MYADKEVFKSSYHYYAGAERRLPIHYYEAKAREIQGDCIHKLLDAVARKVYGFAKGSVAKAFAEWRSVLNGKQIMIRPVRRDNHV